MSGQAIQSLCRSCLDTAAQMPVAISLRLVHYLADERGPPARLDKVNGYEGLVARESPRHILFRVDQPIEWGDVAIDPAHGVFDAVGCAHGVAIGATYAKVD